MGGPVGPRFHTVTGGRAGGRPVAAPLLFAVLAGGAVPEHRGSQVSPRRRVARGHGANGRPELYTRGAGGAGGTGAGGPVPRRGESAVSGWPCRVVPRSENAWE